MANRRLCWNCGAPLEAGMLQTMRRGYVQCAACGALTKCDKEVAEMRSRAESRAQLDSQPVGTLRTSQRLAMWMERSSFFDNIGRLAALGESNDLRNSR